MIHPNKNCACAFSKKRISNENRIKLETAAGFRVILMFQVWFGQIGIYALLTILIIYKIHDFKKYRLYFKYQFP